MRFLLAFMITIFTTGSSFGQRIEITNYYPTETKTFSTQKNVVVTTQIIDPNVAEGEDVTVIGFNFGSLLSGKVTAYELLGNQVPIYYRGGTPTIYSSSLIKLADLNIKNGASKETTFPNPQTIKNHAYILFEIEKLWKNAEVGTMGNNIYWLQQQDYGIAKTYEPAFIKSWTGPQGLLVKNVIDTKNSEATQATTTKNGFCRKITMEFTGNNSIIDGKSCQNANEKVYITVSNDTIPNKTGNWSFIDNTHSSNSEKTPTTVEMNIESTCHTNIEKTYSSPETKISNSSSQSNAKLLDNYKYSSINYSGKDYESTTNGSNENYHIKLLGPGTSSTEVSVNFKFQNNNAYFYYEGISKSSGVKVDTGHPHYSPDVGIVETCN